MFALTYHCAKTVDRKGLVMFLSKRFFFNDIAQSKKKESVSVFYLSDCCLVDHIENISDD